MACTASLNGGRYETDLVRYRAGASLRFPAEEPRMSLITVTESAASQIKRLLDAEGKAASTRCA
jgi:hypothetical protein